MTPAEALTALWYRPCRRPAAAGAWLAEIRDRHRERTADYIQPDLLEPALRELSAFAANNPRQIKAFLALHGSSWISDQIRSRWGDREHYIFDLPALVARQRADRLATMLGVPVERVYYLLDKVLKYRVYAERARGGFYLRQRCAKSGGCDRGPFRKPMPPRPADSMGNSGAWGIGRVGGGWRNRGRRLPPLPNRRRSFV